jgi:hypothetical protein
MYIDHTDSADPSIQADELENMLNWFRHYRDNKGYESYTFIKNTLQAWAFPIPYLIVPKNKPLYRCRPNKEKDWFTKIDELSCRKDILCIKDFGRANEPIQSIFYCSDDPNIAMLESSSTLKSNAHIETEIITTGEWKVQNEFNAGNLIVSTFANNIHETNPAVKKTYEHFLKMVKEFGKQNEYTKLFEFFANEFLLSTTDSRQYITTTAFSNYVFNSNFNGDEMLKALIYPSAIYPWLGMNFAIHTDLIKTDHLKLVRVKKSTLIRNEKGDYEEVAVIYCKEIDYDKGEIMWQ